MANEFFVTKVVCIDCQFEGTGIKSIQDDKNERCFNHWKTHFLGGAPCGALSVKATVVVSNGS